MSRTRAMSSHHTAQLLDAVMHYLPLDVRYQVMREVPAAYNAWCGREVMVTVRAEEAVREPYCNHDAVAVVDGVCECGESVR